MRNKRSTLISDWLMVLRLLVLLFQGVQCVECYSLGAAAWERHSALRRPGTALGALRCPYPAACIEQRPIFNQLRSTAPKTPLPSVAALSFPK
ncbi:hypothetical protein IWX90DRAFT_127924 [Phyllosticta citrichinensis]|uniref:Secreted protein n=1 Tax=Phyllosticta citrichinensis TaxID=1130410 RepID=A0ABR1Y4V6_9PEZI